jgi:hypothetical protein
MNELLNLGFCNKNGANLNSDVDELKSSGL